MNELQCCRIRFVGGPWHNRLELVDIKAQFHLPIVNNGKMTAVGTYNLIPLQTRFGTTFYEYHYQDLPTSMCGFVAKREDEAIR